MAPREFQQLAVGRMVYRLEADDASGDSRCMCLHVLEQLDLRSRRAHDEYLAGIADSVAYRLVVRVVLRSFAGSHDALLVVQVFVLRFRMNHTSFGVVRVEFDDVRFAVIYPDDAMVVAHVVACVMKMGQYSFVTSERVTRAIDLGQGASHVPS